jgi:putative peptidoglycan lipid II flippase
VKNQKSQNPKSKIENRKSTALVMAGILAGNVTGFLREAVIAQHFGLSRWTDAYLIAYTLPEFVFTLLTVVVGGAVIPTFISRRVKEGASSAWSLWGTFTLVLGVTLTVGAAIGIVTAPIYLRWMAPGFSQAELPFIVRLSRPMLMAVVLIGLSVSVSAVLNACRRFTLPSLATAAYNLAFVAAVIGVGAWLGPTVLGWAVLLGAAAHLGLQLPTLKRQLASSTQSQSTTQYLIPNTQYATRNTQHVSRLTFHVSPLRLRSGHGFTLYVSRITFHASRFTHHASRLRDIIRLALPLALGYTIHHAAIAVDRALASALTPGSVAALNFGYRLPQVLGQVLGMAVATVAFPSLAEGAAAGDLAGLRRTLAGGLKLLLGLGLLTLAALMMLRVPLLQFLFQRGAFDAVATAMTASLLVWYAPGVLADMLCQPLWRACYAFRDGRIVVIANAIQTAARVSLNLAFIPVLGAQGIALSFSIGLTIQLCLLAVVVRRRLTAGVTVPEAVGPEPVAYP